MRRNDAPFRDGLLSISYMALARSNLRKNNYRSFAIAEGPCDALVSRNLATTNNPI